ESELDQRDERSGHEELVCDRIEKRAESRRLVQTPREIAVEEIRDRRDQEDAEAEEVGVFSEEDDHEQRNEKNSKQRQRVREIPDLVPDVFLRCGNRPQCGSVGG